MAKLIIRVPATSANLGLGIDSVGLALQLYYTVIVEEKTDEWKVNHALGNDIPTDENNLIVQAILKVNAEIHPHQLTVISDVPIAHGLGSSTTAVVAGIKIANKLGDLGLSIEDQINLGAKFEGHPENVAAALLGAWSFRAMMVTKPLPHRFRSPYFGSDVHSTRWCQRGKESPKTAQTA